MEPSAPRPSMVPSMLGESDETYETPKNVSITVILEGNPGGSGGWIFLTIFNRQILLERKWQNDEVLETNTPLDLSKPEHKLLVTDEPLIFLLRSTEGKGVKDPDPLLHSDNRAGATVDMFPMLLGQEEIFLRVPLFNIITGEPMDCSVTVQAVVSAPLATEDENMPVTLIMTLISVHCLPAAKDGTVYLGAIGLDQVLNRAAVNFGMSLSSAGAKQIVWATASNCGQAANSAFSVPNEDKFTPEDLLTRDNNVCRSFYWNAMKRVYVDSSLLRARISSPIVLEVAGVPRTGKIDTRGRYMAFVDAGVLLEPDIYGVTVCSRLLPYDEVKIPGGALLELPPSSAKNVSARETGIFDEYGHSAYIIIRFDLSEPLVPKLKIANLFENIGLVPPEGPISPIYSLDEDPLPADPCIDVRKIRKESGALAVHKELSGLACRGAVSMNQGIKRTAANRLLMRVRTMLKQFPPGDCSYIEWQDTVTAQHAASRRAVTASFAPQPPPARPPPRVAAARSRMAGNNKISNAHIKENLKVSASSPRALLCKALRCLEERNDVDAKNYVLEGLNVQASNRFLLWVFGGIEFNKGIEGCEMAAAAMLVAVKGNFSDGTANAIGWAALHTLYHVNENPYAAFVAAQKMRKCYELPREWEKFLRRWTDESGEEETFWTPSAVSSSNPLLIAAAFFLCLRCYKFSKRLLECVENDCASRGSHINLKMEVGPDIYYVRAASLVLRGHPDKALQVITQAITMFGPTSILCQMRAMCLLRARGWDEDCDKALVIAEKVGAESCPALLMSAALGHFKTDPNGALQRAARAHKLAPSGHSALVIGRIYAKMKEPGLAERWVAAAVKYEPLLADGWAILALLAMYERKLDKARTMLRTAKQVGDVSPDIEEEVKKAMEIVQLDTLPESLVKNLCLCRYY